MDNTDQLTKIVNALIANPWSIVKLLYLLGIGLYFAFALVVYRQVRMMSHTVQGVLALPLKLISLAHILFVIFVFVLALAIL